MGGEGACLPSFDLQSNNLWEARHRASVRFINAVRTVLARNRCDKRLKILRELVQAIKNGEEIPHSTPAGKDTLPLEKLTLSLSNFKPSVLSHYEDSSKANKTNVC